MSNQTDIEMRLLRLERMQGALIEKVDALQASMPVAGTSGAAYAPSAAPLGVPAGYAAAPTSSEQASPRPAREGMGTLTTIAVVAVALAAIVWLIDELNIDRLFYRLFW
jgi:hypothetical protein